MESIWDQVKGCLDTYRVEHQLGGDQTDQLYDLRNCIQLSNNELHPMVCVNSLQENTRNIIVLYFG